MNRQLVWDRAATRDLAAIARTNRRQAERIEAAAEQLATTGHGDVVKLASQSDLYRLRVGSWRLIFTLDDGGLVVLALRVLNRRDAYR